MKKALCFILCLAMILNVFTFTVFAGTTYTVNTKEYSSGTLDGGFTTHSTAYLPLSDTSAGETTTEPQTGSYFKGTAHVTSEAFSFTGTELVIGSGDTVKLATAVAVQGKNGSLIVSNTGITVKGTFTSLNCEESASNSFYDISLNGDTEIQAGTSYIHYTNDKELTVTGSAIVHVMSGSASTIKLGGNATLYLDNNPNVTVVGSSESTKLYLNIDKSRVNIKGTFGYVYTAYPGTEPNSGSTSAAAVTLTDATTISSGAVNIVETNGKELNLQGGIAYLYKTNCGSTINVYDAKLYVCAKQDAPKTEIITHKKDSYVELDLDVNGASFITGNGGTILLDRIYNDKNQTNLNARIKGEFDAVYAAKNKYKHITGPNTYDVHYYVDRSVTLCGDTTIHSGNAKINTAGWNLNVYGKTDSIYSIQGQEEPNRPKPDTGTFVDRSTIVVGKESETSVAAYVYGDIELSKLVAGDLYFGRAYDFCDGSQTASLNSWCTYVLGDTLETGIGGNLHWNEPKVGYLDNCTFTAIQAIVAGKFNRIETSRFGDYDGVSLVGDTQIVRGENYVNSNLVYFYNWNNSIYSNLAGEYYYYEPGAGQLYTLILGSGDINDRGFETATILSLGYDLGANPNHPHADGSGLYALKIYSGATANITGVAVGYSNMNVEESEDVPFTDNIHCSAGGGHSFFVFDKIYGAKWTNASETDLNVGGTLNVSMGIHEDVVYAAYYPPSYSGDYLMLLDDVPDVITPDISGYFASVTGTVNQADDTVIYNGSNDIYVDEDNQTLSGTYEDVYVGTGYDGTSSPSNVTFSGEANTITVTSGSVTINGQVETITVNGGTVKLVQNGWAKKVIVNGGKFILDGGKVENTAVAEEEYKAVEVKENGFFVMSSGSITLKPSNTFCNTAKYTGVENAGVSYIENGSITIFDGSENKGICNHGLLTVGRYDEETDDGTVYLTLDKGTGIYNAVSSANTNIYDVEINVKGTGSYNNGIGINAVEGQLYILSGDDAIDDDKVNCDGVEGNEACIVNNAAPTPTVVVTVDNGNSGIALNVGNDVTWAVAGLYQTSQFKAAHALYTLSKKSAAQTTAYGVAFDQELVGTSNKTVKLTNSPLTCGKFTGTMESVGCQLDELFPGTVVGSENACDKNFYKDSDRNDDGSYTIVDAEWELRLAMENTNGIADTFVMPIDVQLDLYQGCHGACALDDVDVTAGNHVLNLNGHTLTSAENCDAIHVFGGQLTTVDTANGKGKIVSPTYDAVYVTGGKYLNGTSVTDGAVLVVSGGTGNSVHIKNGTATLLSGTYYGNVKITNGALTVEGGTFVKDVIRNGGDVKLHGGQYYKVIKNNGNNKVAHITNDDDGMICANHVLYGVKLNGSGTIASKTPMNANTDDCSVSGNPEYDYMTIEWIDIKEVLNASNVKLTCNIDLNTPDCAGTVCRKDSAYTKGAAWSITSTKTLDLNGYVLTNSNENSDTIEIDNGGNLTIESGSGNGGKILSTVDSSYVQDDGYNYTDAIYAVAGSLTVKPNFNGYIYQLHVVEGVQASVQGGKYGCVYTTNPNYTKTAPVYDILPNNLDWYRVADSTVLVRNSEFAASTAALSHGNNMDYGERYTVTSAAHILTLSRSSNITTSDNFVLTATAVNPANTMLTWTITGDGRFVDPDNGQNVTTIKKNVTAPLAVTVRPSGQSVVTVKNEYGDSVSFTINPPTGGGGYSGGGGSPAPEKHPVEYYWKDVDNKRYYYDAMQWCYDNSILAPVASNKFGIGGNISRAQFFDALYKAAGSPKVASNATEPFNDVAKTDYYYNAVVWAVTEGLTNGAGANDVFAPDMELDRAQIVTILWRYSGSKVVDGKIDFTDVPDGRYFTKAVDWATANGIINGTGDGTTFSPFDLMLKESAVTMLYRKFVKALF